jgi:NAD(P)-dependent dehydrogenase (short-subunit alcohol dehydrogenase family)
MPSISDQHVVVLGGTSGFGFATAKAALAEGARVTIASRSEEKLRGALARLGNRASGECVDVTDKPMLERFFAGLGPFDHLAVTVGDPLLNKQIMELTDEEARSAFEVRFWGQFNAVRAAYPHISKSGSITLVSGLAGQRASPGRGIYAGVLGGIEGMVKSSPPNSGRSGSTGCAPARSTPSFGIDCRKPRDWRHSNASALASRSAGSASLRISPKPTSI